MYVRGEVQLLCRLEPRETNVVRRAFSGVSPIELSKISH